MLLLARLFPLMFMLTLIAGGLNVVMTGTIADGLIRGAVRDAITAQTPTQLQQSVKEASQYLHLHEAVVGWLAFLAADPDTSGLQDIGQQLAIVKLFAEAATTAGKPLTEKQHSFVQSHLESIQTTSTGVWRPGQRLLGAIVFWAFFGATVTAGFCRFRTQPPAEIESPRQQAENNQAL